MVRSALIAISRSDAIAHLGVYPGSLSFADRLIKQSSPLDQKPYIASLLRLAPMAIMTATELFFFLVY